MNLVNQSVNITLFILLSVVWINPVFSISPPDKLTAPVFLDTTFSCNDLVHVSLDDNCEALITADQIVEGYSGDFNDFIVIIVDEIGAGVPNPVTGAYIGETLTVTAVHVPSGISCWGQILIEDKWAPQLTCSNYTIQCFQNPGSFPLPAVNDNCDSNPTVTLTNEIVNDDNPCTGVIITRTFVAFDNQGNVSAPCSQVYTAVQPSLPDFPEDTTWACHVFNAHPNVVLPIKLTGNLNTTGSGVPDVAIGNYCPYTVTSHSDTLFGCGNTFTLVRTWTVLNWCTGQIITTDINGDDNIQLIKVKDLTGPQIVMPPFNVHANIAGSNSGSCVAISFLPAAAVTDNCHSTTQRIFTPIGEANYINGVNGNAGGLIPFPGLGLGNHIVTYQATDICGNISTLQVTITVVDITAPVAICDEITSVSLDNNGQAEVTASVFNDGSHDNCCLDTFLVRRMSSPCGNQDATFDGTVHFCCEDVGTPVTVVFRAVDCAGNVNDCMVTVDVEDKKAAELVHCPPGQTIECGFYVDSLEIPLSQGDFSVLNQFGVAEFFDNCEVIYLDTSVVVNIDQCEQGTILRRWKVTDPGANGDANCNQTILVKHVSDWVVEFPADITVSCGETIPPTGEPEIFFENCELIAVSYEDEVFTVVPDACFKIARTWTVINWCAVGPNIGNEVVESFELALNFDLNGDGLKNNRTFQDGLNNGNFNLSATLKGAQPDGFITYQQVIKVNDTTDPVVNCEPIIEICIIETDCDATFELPLPEVIDCSTELTITANGALGSGLGPFIDVPLGNYSMTYTVTDHCNNQTACQTLVIVKDCKKPTPYCINGLNVTLEQDTIVTITASDFDAGSFDNCSDSLKFSFSPDVNVTTTDFDCFSIGFVVIQVWVTDDAGNQDFCETFVFVDDNQGVCQGLPLLSGTIVTESQAPVKDVIVNLNGTAQNTMMTGEDGKYDFEVPNGGDYSVSAWKDSNPMNGVTTFDLVLISKHILGNQILDSPYKIIAADANKSKSVTTADLVAIRKVILQIENGFPNNQSWRFVRKDFVFPDPVNPFSTMFPEVWNFNDVVEDAPGADFIAIKVGDVNMSANPQQ
jgi:hypothetical protein